MFIFVAKIYVLDHAVIVVELKMAEQRCLIGERDQRK